MLNSSYSAFLNFRLISQTRHTSRRLIMKKLSNHYSISEPAIWIYLKQFRACFFLAASLGQLAGRLS